MENLGQQIRDRITILESERDKFLQQANQQIAMINAVIGELKALIGEDNGAGENDQKGNHKEPQVSEKIEKTKV